MYYPKSQIKSNLSTSGTEYQLATTGERYKGFYYEISNGKKYTGKTPEDGLNILLIPIQTDSPFNFNQSPNPEYIITQDEISNGFYNKNPQVRSIPKSNITTPTLKDYSLNVFSRYFCKKSNELVYLEINKETFDLLKNKDSKIAWDLYIPQTLLWQISGNKEQTYKANNYMVHSLESDNKWYGFSKFLKEDYLKYFLES